MRRINKNHAVWFIILLMLSFYIFYLCITGTLERFVHPRMFTYIYVALGVLMVMAAFQATRIPEGGGERIKRGYVVFLLPLVCGMLFHPGSLNEDISKSKGVVISPNQADLEYGGQSYVEGAVINGIITLTENNFTKVLYSIWSNPDQYVGRKIAVTGFTYKNEAMAANQLIISRMVINCCAADTILVGLAAQLNGENKIHQNDWIKVMGTIAMMRCINPLTSEEETVPGIMVESLENIEKPENPYVYP